MKISKIGMSIAAGAFALTSAVTISTAAFAGTKIASASDCQFEGGSMVNVKGSDYCLVQIRPKEYEGADYDGNQLGVVDCPGSKLNDGAFCMYPVSTGKSAGGAAGYVKSAPAVIVPQEVVTPAPETASKSPTIIEQVTDIAKDEAEKAAKKEAREKAKKGLKKLF